MRLEGVITCVDYSDFLGHTLLYNKGLFDHLVVATAPEDESTQRVCEFYHVECVLTDAFDARWGNFNKGAGINAGLAALSMDDWVVHLDADVALPPLTRVVLERADLDRATLYGCDRHMVPSSETWLAHLNRPLLQQEDDVYVHVDSFPLGARIASPDYHGYVPIGFFQMWCPSVSGVHRYPTDHTDAGRTDMLFASGWPRSRRALLPELVAYHLASEPETEQGVNWHGRVTKTFGVTSDRQASSHARATPKRRKHRSDDDDTYRHKHHHHRDDDR